jgi:hypothetical protein
MIRLCDFRLYITFFVQLCICVYNAIYSSAQISIMALNFLTGFVFVLAYFILISIDKTRVYGDGAVHIFRYARICVCVQYMFANSDCVFTERHELLYVSCVYVHSNKSLLNGTYKNSIHMSHYSCTHCFMRKIITMNFCMYSV